MRIWPTKNVTFISSMWITSCVCNSKYDNILIFSFKILFYGLVFTSGFFRMLIFVYTELLTSFMVIATFPLPTIGSSKILPFKLYVASIRSFGMTKSNDKSFFSKSRLHNLKSEKEEHGFLLVYDFEMYLKKLTSLEKRLCLMAPSLLDS